MQREEADPSGGMNGVLVRVVSAFRNQVRNIVDRDDAVEQHHDHEDQDEEREVIQERVAQFDLPGSSWTDLIRGMTVPGPRTAIVRSGTRKSLIKLKFVGLDPMVGSLHGACV